MSSRLHFGDSNSAAAVGSDAPSAWEDTLADLEANVERVADAVRTEAFAEEVLDLDSSWVPPADLGPLPEHLRERATLLLSRQLAVAEALVHDITWSKQQRDVAARLSYAKTRPAGAFFDNKL